MDFSQLTLGAMFVLMLVLLAEAANGWTDAPCSTSSAVASGTLSSRQALWLTVIGNFMGLMLSLAVGAKVASTVGTGIVRQEIVTLTSIGVAMVTTLVWTIAALMAHVPVSKTHSLFAALAGIGLAQGGFHALTPESGYWLDSGWVKAGIGIAVAIIAGFSVSWFLSRIIYFWDLSTKIPEIWWRRFQKLTVSLMSVGHGFNDGLKYVGIFTLVLLKSGVIHQFVVHVWVIVLCAITMAFGTMLGGKRIQQRLDMLVNQSNSKKFESYMGVSSEATAAFLVLQTGWLGIPTSTNHATVSTMAGARSAKGKLHTGSIVRIVSMWVVTYIFCSAFAYLATRFYMR